MAMNMTDTMGDINSYLAYLFPNKPIFAYDNLNMTISYYFGYTPSDEELAIISIDGVLPRPAGVEALQVFDTPQDIFGFSGQRLGQLDNSVFADEPIITDGRVMWTEGVFINTGSAFVAWE
jgi:hypothetical protein